MGSSLGDQSLAVKGGSDPEEVRREVEDDEEDDCDPIEWDDMNMPQFLLFGSLISVSCDLHLYPFELVKTRLQVQVVVRPSFTL